MQFLANDKEFEIVLLRLGLLLQKPVLTQKEKKEVHQLLEITDFMLRNEVIEDVHLLNLITKFTRRSVVLN